ncbi:Catalase [Poriferisphaera corsica]|uniref:catalase n=1 Tax=Poriferisphaera corsica TaxID=2528020 RepID=A0A517YPF7_9BACT|nr:Catalase [Poriferisphaera corsica]
MIRKQKDKQDQLLTTASGIPVGDNQNSLTAGERGPVLIQDYHMMEKLAHFNRERIPERIVHAKGSGAYGHLTVKHDISKYTCAKLFDEINKKTECFVRFSTVGGEQGSADAERDPRGFAVKLYTEEGNWDLVGNNTPIFFIRDGVKFPDFIHTQKRCPMRHVKDPNMMWDFWSLSPESLHQVTILFSDRGIPATYRHMNGYGSHTFSMINDKGKRVWCKFHFKTNQGIMNLSANQAERMKGEDPDHAQRDLFDAIERGEYPSWRFCIQVMSEEQAEKVEFNPFDLTKVWSHKMWPLIDVGVLELNRNPVNYFAEVEQSAFSPSDVVPGIGFSPDKMLQARIMSYPDAQRYRLGTNYQQLDVNRPRCPYENYQRDGQMSQGFGGDQPNYDPNSIQGTPKENREYNEPALDIGHAIVDRYDHRKGNDDFTQAGDLYRLMTDDEQQRLVENIVNSLKNANKVIQERQIVHFYNADHEYGERIAKHLKLTLPKKQGVKTT